MLLDRIASDLNNNPFDDDVLHIFIVGNPVMAMVASMLIKKWQISTNQLRIYNIRKQNTAIIRSQSESITDSKLSRIFLKTFGQSLIGIRLAKRLNRENYKFVLYANWMTPELEKLVQCNNCLGHIYLEEGQMSHYPVLPYPRTSRITTKQRLKNISQGIEMRYRDDAVAYVGILPDAFPLVNKQRRLILSNFESVKAIYTPRLIGIENIAVLPAPHRVALSDLEENLNFLVDKMDSQGAIAMHPGFASYPNHRACVLNYVKRKKLASISVCDFSTILELEMMFEPKVIFGPRSSVSIYSEFFGSRYDEVVLPNYLPPVN